MKKKKSTDSDNLIITELMLFKADWNRTFVAEICRETTSEGVSIVRGTVMVNEGKILAVGETMEELALYLDELCILKLDYGLHSVPGVTTKVFDTDFFLN